MTSENLQCEWFAPTNMHSQRLGATNEICLTTEIESAVHSTRERQWKRPPWLQERSRIVFQVCSNVRTKRLILCGIRSVCQFDVAKLVQQHAEALFTETSFADEEASCDWDSI